MTLRSFARVFLYFCFFSFAGCASNTYVYGTGVYGDTSLSPEMEQQVIVGKPNKVLDASDWYWPLSLLAKLFLWNRKVDSHEISEETIEELMVYLDKNDLSDVQVLVNAYKPGLQWKRLRQNKEVGAGWRYTLGALSVLLYTILPGRVVGGDHYNAYTNTISIYSDDPSIALHEGGHAKDFNSMKNKGLNAAFYIVPGAALYYEGVATRDTVSYLRNSCRDDDEKEAYKTLHPAYGTYIGGVTRLGLIAAIPGHITGAIASDKVDDKPKPPKCEGPDNEIIVSSSDDDTDLETNNKIESEVDAVSDEPESPATEWKNDPS